MTQHTATFRSCSFEQVAECLANDVRAAGQPVAVVKMLERSYFGQFRVYTAESIERLCLAIDLIAGRAVVIHEPA